jgi:hypothetical protein
MYLRPFLLIQVLAFVTTEIWATFRLRGFGLESLEKLKALANAGYVPIPLPDQLSGYLQVGSLIQAGSFFTFTLGFTLGLVALGGAFCLNRFRLSKPVRLGWTVLLAALASFVLGFHPLELLLFVGFFAAAHLAVNIPDAPFHKAALLILIPLILLGVLFRGPGFLTVRDFLLQNTWGEKTVTFYYRFSPFTAELITPRSERTQVTVWTGAPLGKAAKLALMRKGVYPISTKEGADLILPNNPTTGPAVLEAIQTRPKDSRANRLRQTIYYSIFFALPLAIVLFLILATDRLLSLSRYVLIILVLCVGVLSAFLAYRALSQKAWEPGGAALGEGVETIRRWVLHGKRTGDPRTRQHVIEILNSNNPAVRLWAATALASLPSRNNVEPLKKIAANDPVQIVRCKAILALSHQRDRGVIPFLESRLKGQEDWYVKHYLFRALRRLGWIG